ncbi:MAG TPA: ABC transporter substrate-binding protein [Burkholderiales bacterium]|jgi:polar amino acid transport system substrate-binding protein|nr:ABC transporter substrate-binding protein [Burkholderiales bacterium]
MTSAVSPDTQRDLAPTGKLRVGLNYGNFLLVLRDKPDGTPQGIAPDLARELAKRLEMGVEFIKFEAAGKLADGVKTGAWDVAFLGNEPQRAAEIAFSPAYLEIPVTYLVPAGSPIQALADVDKKGVRIAVADKSAYHLFMMRELKSAELVSADGIDGSYKLFIDSKLDALAGLKPRLLTDQQKNPGSRVLDGQLTTVQQSIGVPKSHEAAARYLKEFAEEMKKSGFVAEAIARHKVPGVAVAP